MTGDPGDHIADITRAHAKRGVSSLVLSTSSATIEQIGVSLEAMLIWQIIQRLVDRICWDPISRVSLVAWRNMALKNPIP